MASTSGVKQPSKIPIQRKKRGLTIKQRKFIARTVETGNATQSAMDVYDVKSRRNAKILASQNLAKDYIKEAIEKALEAKGVSPEYIIGKLQENIEAGTGVDAKASDANKALQILTNLMTLNSQREEKNIYNFNFSNMAPDEIKAKLEELRTQNSDILND